jgi:hypothetical protein
MNRYGEATSRHSRFHEILTSVRRAHRSFATRTCVACGASYLPTLHASGSPSCCEYCEQRFHQRVADDVHDGGE